VGADYNLLLISRIREEAVGRGIRSGVIRTRRIGPVASSPRRASSSRIHVGPDGSSISNIVQTASSSASDYLLDTFVVRTITVPAMAVIVGNANWWPAGRKAAKPRKVRWQSVHDDGRVTELAAASRSFKRRTQKRRTAELNGAVDIDEKDTAIDPLARSAMPMPARCGARADATALSAGCGELSGRLAASAAEASSSSSRAN